MGNILLMTIKLNIMARIYKKYKNKSIDNSLFLNFCYYLISTKYLFYKYLLKFIVNLYFL